MKILYVGGFGKYGSLTLSRDLMEMWLKHGHEVVLAACSESEPNVEFARRHQIPVYFTRPFRAFQFNQAFRLAQIARLEKIGVIHACLFPPGMFLCRIAALVSKKPLVLYIGTSGGVYNRNPAIRLLKKALYRWVIETSAGIIAMTHFLADQLESEFGIKKNIAIEVIPHGVDLSLIRKKGFVPFRNRGEGNRRPRAVQVARLAPEKGQDLTLKALAILVKQGYSLSVDFIGDESSPGYTAYLQALRQKLDLPQTSVNFLGYQPLSEIYRLLPAYDIFLHPSRDEGQGIAVVEAMAAGLPVVASAVGGLKEMVSEGETGLLVEPENHNELAKGILSLIQDDVRRSKMGEAGHRRVQEDFSLATTEKKFISFYERKFGLRSQAWVPLGRH